MPEAPVQKTPENSVAPDADRDPSAPAAEPTALTSEDVTESSSCQEEVQTPVSEEADAQPQDPFTFASVDSVVGTLDKKPKKKLWTKVLPAVIAVVLIAAILFNLSYFTGLAIKLFGSDAAYFEYVEAKEFKHYANTISSYYDAILLNNLESDQSADVALNLHLDNLAPELLSLAGLNASSIPDLSWLSNITLNLSTNTYKDLQSVGVGLALSDVNILSLSAILDMANEALYLACPELTDYTLFAEIELNPDEFGILLQTDPKAAKQFADILPSEKEFKKLLIKYVNIALESIEKGSSFSETVKVNDLKQKCTVLEITVTQRDLVNIAEAIIEEAVEDKQIKEIITKLEKYLISQGLSEYVDPDDLDLYGEFVSTAKNALRSLAGARLYASRDELFTIKDYVNGKHEIIGREISVEDEQLLYYITVQDGKKFASYAEIGAVCFEGEGTKRGDKTNGDYTFTVDDQTLFELNVEDFDTKSIESGFLNGTFRVKPLPALFAQSDMDSGTATMLFLLSPAVELKYNSSKKASTVELNLLSKNAVLAGVTLDARLSGGKSVSVNKSNLLDVDDDESGTVFLASLKFGSVLNKLKQAGVPGEILDQLEAILDEAGLL